MRLLNEFFNGILKGQNFGGALTVYTEKEIEELKSQGTIVLDERRENGLITKSISFVAFDGKRTFFQTQSYWEMHEDKMELKKLQALKEQAIVQENYEEAGRLTGLINELTVKNK